MIVPAFPLPRYALPFVAPCTLVAAYVWERFSRSPRAGRALTAVVVFVLLVQLVPFAGRAAARVRVVSGMETREQYLLRADDVYPMARRAAQMLPPNAKVLYVGERVYHFLALGVNADMGMPARQAAVDFPAFRTPAGLMERIRGLGYTHVIVNEAVLAARTPFALNLLRPLEGAGLRELAREKRLVLYEVESRPAKN
jgi:hypothetical protein